MIPAALGEDPLEAAVRLLTRLSESPSLHIAAPHLAECQLLFIIMFTLSFLELGGKRNISYIQGSFKSRKTKMNQEEYSSVFDMQTCPCWKPINYDAIMKQILPALLITLSTWLLMGIWVCSDSCNKIRVEIHSNTCKLTKGAWKAMAIFRANNIVTDRKSVV